MNKKIGIVVGLVLAVWVLWTGVRYFNNQNVLPTVQDGNSSVTAPVGSTNASAPKATTARTSAPITRNVTIKGLAYSPSTINIRRGDKVVWTNMDTAAHTITGSTDGPNSSALGQTQKYDFIFGKVGTYTYHCNFHPSMSGTVVVTN